MDYDDYLQDAFENYLDEHQNEDTNRGGRIMMSAVTIEANPTVEEFKIITDIDSLVRLTYPEVPEFVGGMVEAITFPNDDLLLLNEEGKLIGMPLNPECYCIVENDSHVKKHISTDYDDWVSGHCYAKQ